MQQAATSIKKIYNRSQDIGISISFSSITTPVIPFDQIVQKVKTVKSSFVHIMAINSHFHAILTAYFVDGDVSEAIFNANMIKEYDVNNEHNIDNTLGYLHMSSGDLDKAESYLLNAILAKSDKLSNALSYYNLGILGLMKDDYDGALINIDICLNSVSDLADGDRECSSLFMPEITKDGLKIIEIRSVDLLETSRAAKDNLVRFLGNS